MKWDNLTLGEKSELMKLYLKNGITSLSDMKEHYNSYQGGGGLKKIITNTVNKIQNPFQADKETLKKSEDVNRQNAERTRLLNQYADKYTVQPYSATLITYPYLHNKYLISHSALAAEGPNRRIAQVSKQTDNPGYNLFTMNCADLTGEILNLNTKGILTTPNSIREQVLNTRNVYRTKKDRDGVLWDYFPISKSEYDRIIAADKRNEDAEKYINFFGNDEGFNYSRDLNSYVTPESTFQYEDKLKDKLVDVYSFLNKLPIRMPFPDTEFATGGSIKEKNVNKYQEDGPLKIPSYIRQSGILNYDITLPRKIQWNKNLKNGVLYNRGYETAPDGVTITKAGRPIIAMPTFNNQFNNDNIGDEVVVTYYDKELNRKIPVKHIVGDWKDSSKDALGPFGSHIKYPKHRKKPFYSFIEPWMESKNSLEKSSLWKGIYNSDNNFENNLPPNVVIESIEPTGHNIIDDPKYFETVDDNFTGLIFLDPIEITAERN